MKSFVSKRDGKVWFVCKAISDTPVALNSPISFIADEKYWVRKSEENPDTVIVK